MKKFFVYLALTCFLYVGAPIQTNAQCAMCKVNAQNSVTGEKKIGLGLNDGILMLLSMPYAVVTVVGIIWYRNMKKEKQKQLSSTSSNLNI